GGTNSIMKVGKSVAAARSGLSQEYQMGPLKYRSIRSELCANFEPAIVFQFLYSKQLPYLANSELTTWTRVSFVSAEGSLLSRLTRRYTSVSPKYLLGGSSVEASFINRSRLHSEPITRTGITQRHQSKNTAVYKGGWLAQHKARCNFSPHRSEKVKAPQVSLTGSSF
ncbi:hypothetical protein J6590_099612, partial [Homalodisca vitripennis]